MAAWIREALLGAGAAALVIAASMRWAALGDHPISTLFRVAPPLGGGEGIEHVLADRTAPEGNCFNCNRTILAVAPPQPIPTVFLRIIGGAAARQRRRAPWPEMDPVVPRRTVGFARREQDVRTFSLYGLSIEIDDVADVVETKKLTSTRSHNEVLSGVVGLRTRFGMFIEKAASKRGRRQVVRSQMRICFEQREK